MSARYVVLGLAHPRAPWFAEVGRWARQALSGHVAQRIGRRIEQVDGAK